MSWPGERGVRRARIAVITVGAACAVLGLVGIVLSPGPRGAAGGGGHAAAATRAADVSRWACEMGCERGKTYASPGVCLVCKMAMAPASERPFTLSVEARSAVVTGAPSRLRIVLRDPAGAPASLDPDAEAILVAVADDLSWTWAEAARPEADGGIDAGPALPTPGRYEVYAMFRPTGFGRQTVSAAFRVAGDVPAPATLEEDFDAVKHAGGCEFRVRCNGARFFAGEESFLRFGADESGRPVEDFEPIDGQPARVLVLRLSPREVVGTHAASAAPFLATGTSVKLDEHVHTRDVAAKDGPPNPASLMNGKPSDVVARVIFPAPGVYEVMACFKRKGALLHVPFTIDAQPPRAGAPRPDRSQVRAQAGAQPRWAGTPAHRPVSPGPRSAAWPCAARRSRRASPWSGSR